MSGRKGGGSGALVSDPEGQFLTLHECEAPPEVAVPQESITGICAAGPGLLLVTRLYY